METEQINHIVEEAKQLSYDELKTVSERILEMLDDIKWDELLTSQKSQAYAERRRKAAIEEHLAGKTVQYIPGKSIAELFQECITNNTIIAAIATTQQELPELA